MQLSKEETKAVVAHSLSHRNQFSPAVHFGSPGPLLRNHNLGGGGKFQTGDLIFDTGIISLYELLRKAVFLTSYKLW